jgi:hypothetical protein
LITESFMSNNELARRAAMLREAADAFPPGSDRDQLLLQVFAPEERLRAPTLQQAMIPVNIRVDAAA